LAKARLHGDNGKAISRETLESVELPAVLALPLREFSKAHRHNGLPAKIRALRALEPSRGLARQTLSNTLNCIFRAYTMRQPSCPAIARSGITPAALAALMLAASALPLSAAPAGKPVAGQQVHFDKGAWNALPQTGPDGKVRQCNLVALRQRVDTNGPTETRFVVDISKGSGLTFVMQDERLPHEAVIDDQAEIMIDERSFPAVGFNVGTAFAFHPGDARAAQAALARARRVSLRSDGAGIDSGAINLELPAQALNWLIQCGRTFEIAIDRSTDPDAVDMPSPRPRSPKIAITVATPAGPPGIEDKQKIDGWDASELRNGDGEIIVCLIRRHYRMSAEPDARRLGTFLMVSRAKGLTLMLKDSSVDRPEDEPVETTLAINDQPFTAFSAHMLGRDEIGIFPQHGVALAAALEHGAHVDFKSAASRDKLEFPVGATVVPWLRACARRNGIAIDQQGS
jgi:invasion protein IalB